MYSTSDFYITVVLLRKHSTRQNITTVNVLPYISQVNVMKASKTHLHWYHCTVNVTICNVI